MSSSRGLLCWVSGKAGGLLGTAQVRVGNMAIDGASNQECLFSRSTGFVGLQAQMTYAESACSRATPARVAACCRHMVAPGGIWYEKQLPLSPGVLGCRQKVTQAENGITNGIEIFQNRTGATYLMTSNNDQMVRVLDTENFSNVRHGPVIWTWPHVFCVTHWLGTCQ